MNEANTPPKSELSFSVNGQQRTVQAWPMTRLLDVLRETLKLTGTKEGCGEGECGACSVFIDDILVNSCLVPVCQVAGRRVQTIEGVASEPQGPPLQTAFVEHGGAQCGFCTPGMVMAATSLVAENPSGLDETAVRQGLEGNLCRCTGYHNIVKAVLSVGGDA